MDHDEFFFLNADGYPSYHPIHILTAGSQAHCSAPWITSIALCHDSRGENDSVHYGTQINILGTRQG